MSSFLLELCLSCAHWCKRGWRSQKQSLTGGIVHRAFWYHCILSSFKRWVSRRKGAPMLVSFKHIMFNGSSCSSARRKERSLNLQEIYNWARWKWKPCFVKVSYTISVTGSVCFANCVHIRWSGPTRFAPLLRPVQRMGFSFVVFGIDHWSYRPRWKRLPDGKLLPRHFLGISIRSFLCLMLIHCYTSSQLGNVWSRVKVAGPLWYLPMIPWLTLQLKQRAIISPRLQNQQAWFFWLAWWIFSYGPAMSWEGFRCLECMQKAQCSLYSALLSRAQQLYS